MGKNQYIEPGVKMIFVSRDADLTVNSILINPAEEEHQDKAEGKRFSAWEDL